MHDKQLSKYAVSGNEEVWQHELKSISDPGVVSIPRYDYLISYRVEFTYVIYFSFSLSKNLSIFICRIFQTVFKSLQNIYEPFALLFNIVQNVCSVSYVVGFL